MLDKLKAKGREILVILTAVAMLLSVAGGVVFDALAILIVGSVGWFASEPEAKDGN